jgi:hypothetical protein
VRRRVCGEHRAGHPPDLSDPAWISSTAPESTIRADACLTLGASSAHYSGGAVDLPDGPAGPNDLTRLEQFNPVGRRFGAVGYIR